MRKILLVSTGQSTLNAFKQPEYKLYKTSVCNLKLENMWRYDIVVICSWGDQWILYNMHNQFIEYARNGGILIILGAQAQEIQWLPFCQWIDSLPVIPSRLMDDSESNMIFENINIEQMIFHGSFFCHGYLHPGIDSKIIAKADDNPVLLIADRGISGAVLITTIDADWHYVYGMRNQNSVRDKISMDIAARFLANILKWGSYKFDERNSDTNRRLRYLYSIPSRKGLYISAVILVWIITIVITLSCIIQYKNYDFNNVIPGIASLIGLCLYLYESYKSSY